jgi:hypothetical protein
MLPRLDQGVLQSIIDTAARESVELDFKREPLRAPHDEDFHDLVAARYERAATILTSNLDLDEWGDAFPDNRVLGAATLDRLRHGCYRIVLEGESFRKPRPMPENGENVIAKSGKKPHS